MAVAITNSTMSLKNTIVRNTAPGNAYYYRLFFAITTLNVVLALCPALLLKVAC